MTTKQGINKKVIAMIDVAFRKHSLEGYDSVWGIGGDEGTGKSSLAAWLLHYWLLRLNGEVVEDDYRLMALDKEQFLSALKTLPKGGGIVFDETDIISRQSMAKANIQFMKMYQIIRAKQFLSVLVLPSLFDLDGFFRKRRLRGYFHVTKRGVAHFWSKTKLRKMVALNDRLPVKNPFVVKPTHTFAFSAYDGPFEGKYREAKDEKMRTIIEDIEREFEKEDKGDDELIHERLFEAFADGVKTTEICKKWNINPQMLSSYKKKWLAHRMRRGEI